MKKTAKILFVLCALFALAALTGCVSKPAEELYALPALSDQYVNLQDQINQVLKTGASYSAPISGSNRQAVQLQDLDGDGMKEAIAFFGTVGEGKPLQLCIYEYDGETYSPACTIEGEGSKFESVSYADMNGDGMDEIIVGWQISSELKMLSIYSITNYQVTALLSTDYTEYTMYDMDSSGTPDLLLVRMSASELSGQAQLYMLMKDGELTSSQARLSDGVESLTHMRTGTLRDGSPSIYLESAINTSDIVTDIFIYDDGNLKNVTLNAETGVSSETLRSYAMYSRDMNGDGVLEVPNPVQLPTASESSTYWEMEWYDYTSGGHRMLIMTTYHNTTDGWYFILPDTWAGRIAVRREDGTGGERAVIFSAYNGDTKAIGDDFLVLYTFSGETAAEDAVSDGRFKLLSAEDTVCAAKILGNIPDIRVDETVIRQNFNLIYSEWMSGETN